MKNLVMYLLVFVLALLNCGAVDGPDTPTDVEVGVVSNPLNPLTDLSGYRVYFIQANSLPGEIHDSTVVEVKPGGRLYLRFMAPVRFTDAAVEDLIYRYVYPVENESVAYTDSSGTWQAYFEFDVNDVDAGLYTLRCAAVSNTGKRGNASQDSVNWVRVEN